MLNLQQLNAPSAATSPPFSKMGSDTKYYIYNKNTQSVMFCIVLNCRNSGRIADGFPAVATQQINFQVITNF